MDKGAEYGRKGFWWCFPKGRWGRAMAKSKRHNKVLKLEILKPADDMPWKELGICIGSGNGTWRRPWITLWNVVCAIRTWM